MFSCFLSLFASVFSDLKIPGYAAAAAAAATTTTTTTTKTTKINNNNRQVTVLCVLPSQVHSQHTTTTHPMLAAISTKNHCQQLPIPSVQ
jgi:hypothetical protein